LFYDREFGGIKEKNEGRKISERDGRLYVEKSRPSVDKILLGVGLEFDLYVRSDNQIRKKFSGRQSF